MWIFLLLLAASGFCQQTASWPEVDTPVRACTGRDVDLLWPTPAVEEDEELVRVEWYFTPSYLSPGNCTQRWSEWISRDNPNSAHDDVEKMTTQEMTQFCPGGHVTDIQCRSRQGFPVEDGEEGMVCNVAQGFLCRDADVSPARCNDYEVRYFCRCSATGNDEVLLATFTSNTFVRSSSATQVVTFHNDTQADVTLHDVSEMDEGVYRVVVDVVRSRDTPHPYFSSRGRYFRLSVDGVNGTCSNTTTMSSSHVTTSHDVTSPNQADVTAAGPLIG